MMNNRLRARGAVALFLAAAWMCWPAAAQDTGGGLPDAPATSTTVERAQPRRLADYNLPGLDTPVVLKSLEPWDVVQLIEFLAYRGGLNNIVIGKGVSGMTTKLKFDNVTVRDALEVVLSVNNLAYEIKGGIVTIMTDEEYSATYGRSFYDNKHVKVVDLRYADPARVAGMLQPLKSALGTIVADPVSGTIILIDTPDKIVEMEAIIRKADISTVARVLPTQTRTFRLQYADVESLRDEVSAMLTPEIGALRADVRTKSLIVTDLPHRMQRIEEVISVFDERQKQVFIEAKIVEVNLNDEFRLGVKWEHFLEAVDPRFSLRSAIAPIVSGPGGGVTPPAGVGTLTYKTIVGGGDLEAVLAALKTVGDTKILSNPHVAVVSDEEATIKVVRDVPYAEAQLESGTTNVVGERITFIEVGVKLGVTPRINDEGLISMAIRPEVSSVVGQYQAFRTVPIVQKAFAETSVMVKDGETIIIAGMIVNEKQETQSRVPWLGRIPLIGLLFSSRSEAVETREIIVFLTPRIISGEEPVLLMRDLDKRPKPMRTIGPGRKDMKPVR